MNLSNLKNEFVSNLSEIYPIEEATSLFFILVQSKLKLDRFEVALQPEKDISEKVYSEFKKAMIRLGRHEPIQYVIGETEFYGLLFNVNEHTLIPRPETEELVDWVLTDVKSSRSNHMQILDIGTGSGCIAISLAKGLINSHVSGLDVSKEALKIAQKNAALHDVKVDFSEIDIFEIDTLEIQYNLIVSNPPYVRALEKVAMKNNVLQYEPEIALFVSDDDPLIFYRKIIQLAKNGLVEGGLLYLEINEYLSNELVTLLAKEGFRNIEVKKDIFEKDRMIKANRP